MLITRILRLKGMCRLHKVCIGSRIIITLVSKLKIVCAWKRLPLWTQVPGSCKFQDFGIGLHFMTHKKRRTVQPMVQIAMTALTPRRTHKEGNSRRYSNRMENLIEAIATEYRILAT